MVGTGLGLFVLTVLALLGVQGRLTYEGTKQIPLLHSCFPEPEAPAPRRLPRPPSGEGTAGGTVAQDPAVSTPAQAGQVDGAAGRETKVEGALPVEGVAALAGTDWPYGEIDGGDPLFAFDRLPPGMTVEEIDAVIAHARQAEAELVAARAEVEERDRGLRARERDLEARQEQLTRLIEQVEEERAKVEARIAAFHSSVIALRPDEAAAYRATANTVASLDPEIARNLIEDYWRSADGQERVVKILSVMEPRRADAILGLLDTRVMREVLERRMAVVQARVHERKTAPGAPPGGPGNE
jgi:hypothetical protein